MKTAVIWTTCALLVGCSVGESSSPAPTAQVFRTPAGVAAKPLAQRHTGLAIADELVVVARPGVDPNAVELMALDAGGEVIWRGPRTGAYVVRFDDGAAAQAGYRLLVAHPDVAEVSFNRVMRGRSGGSGIGTSPGILQGLQWNIPALRLDAAAGWGEAEGVVVAVLDSGAAYEEFADDLGVYALAPDLAEVEFLAGYDFINDDEHPNDDHGHGTHVTGVIAASAGISALAPHADVLPVKVLDADNLGTELALAEGLYYAADSGADVVNMSLSFPPTYFPSRYLQAAVDHAAQQGVVLVAAVGNHDEDVVTYPAAFRDVIAVGASALDARFRPDGGRDDSGELPEDGDRWADAFDHLVRAPYSNRGYLVDVAAPAGRIDQDLDGDGNPEALLAQTFAPGDPTAFDYYFYAGTSQATAEVSGLAAVMLAANPDLTAPDVRSVLGETADPDGWTLLSTSYGRGRVSGAAALAAASDAAATRPRTRLHASVFLTLHETGHRRRARAEVEVLDEQGAPVPYVAVYGSFTGAAFESRRRWTDENGVAVFKSKKFGTDGKVVAFQVDGIGYWDWSTLRPALDRPRGFVRIDSVSLELLATFAQMLVEGGELGGLAGDSEAASGAGGAPGGSGIGTSPGDMLPGSPEQIPITIRYEVDDSGTLSHMVPSLMLPNFSWGMATVPMAVIVEEDWFLTNYPDAEQRLVVSYGSGIGTSPLRFDPIMSFPTPVVLDYDTDPPQVTLVLATFSMGSGIGTSPGFRPIFADFFNGSGIGTSPGLIDEALSLHWTYWWDQLAGSGIGTSPGVFPGIPPAVFEQLGNATEGYVRFGLTQLSSPVGAYGPVLEAAGLELAPVDPMADGTGNGTSPLLP